MVGNAAKAMATRQAKRESASVLKIQGGEIRGDEDGWIVCIGSSQRYFQSLSAITRFLFERDLRTCGARSVQDLVDRATEVRSNISRLFDPPTDSECEDVVSDLLG